MGDYFRQNLTETDFNSIDSWVGLAPIEQSIKAKIEAVGTPLKDWDISINRGILTGYNEAFIIDGKKREELINQDPKSAEIIRPYNLHPNAVKHTIHNVFQFPLDFYLIIHFCNLINDYKSQNIDF